MPDLYDLNAIARSRRMSATDRQREINRILLKRIARLEHEARRKEEQDAPHE